MVADARQVGLVGLGTACPMSRIRSGSASSGSTRASISWGSVDQRPPWLPKPAPRTPLGERVGPTALDVAVPRPLRPDQDRGPAVGTGRSAECPAIMRPSAGNATVRAVTVVMGRGR